MLHRTLKISSDLNILLVIFGLLVVVGLGYFVIRQFTSGASHLLTYRNAFLGGMIIFFGISTLGLALTGKFYTRPIPADIYWYLFYSAFFIFGFVFFYQRIRAPRIVVDFLQKGPPEYRPEFTYLIAVFALACSLYNFFLNGVLYIPFVSECLRVLSFASITFAATFSMAGWLKNKQNFAALIFSLGIMLICMVLAVVSGSGRRIMLGVVLGPVVMLYWSNRRSLTREVRTRLLLTCFGLMVPLAVFMAAYNNLRHFDRGGLKGGRSFSNSLATLLDTPQAIFSLDDEIMSGDILAKTGQDTTACGLLLMQMDRSGPHSGLNGDFAMPQPMHSMLFVLTNPIPRRIWDNKPLPLGYTLPIVGLRARGVNLGAGVVGHAVHEGGFLPLLFYMVFFAGLVKTFDTALINKSSDVVQQGLLASMAPNMVALPRGDIGVVMMTFVFSIVAYKLIRFVGRYFEVRTAAATDAIPPQMEPVQMEPVQMEPVPLEPTPL